MTTTVRALIFGTAIAAVSALTLTAVFAAEPVQVVRLDGVTVTAHRDHFDCDGNLTVVELEPVMVTARKNS
jgi:hypothetical protein